MTPTPQDALAARLLEHAAVHDAVVSEYSPEQKQWADDLRSAAAALRGAVPAVPADRVRECAQRLVDGADFQLAGALSAQSKAKDIPSKACSQVKARHLASLRDALAEAAAPKEQA
jgi:hypothetical protein